MAAGAYLQTAASQLMDASLELKQEANQARAELIREESRLTGEINKHVQDARLHSMGESAANDDSTRAEMHEKAEEARSQKEEKEKELEKKRSELSKEAKEKEEKSQKMKKKADELRKEAADV